MIVCFDVHYQDDSAVAAAILFESWQDTEPTRQFTVRVPDIGAYQPGSFYQRELKPLLAAVNQIQEDVDCFVIDAYCHLSEDLSPGLGSYFHEQLSETATVIGVAKNRFRDTTHAIELCRGESQKPLFVKSIGIEYSKAAELIGSMAGEYRIPTLLKSADRLCRDAI